MSGVWLLTIYHNDKLYASLTYSSAFFTSLLVVCTSYLTIHLRLLSRAPDSDIYRQASTEKTLRMSRTFFKVIAVSLVFWLPSFVMLTTEEFWSCFSPLEVWFVIVLQLGNSMVNPFVNTFRMPIFQDALKKCWRKRRQNIQLRVISKKSHNTERNL